MRDVAGVARGAAAVGIAPMILDAGVDGVQLTEVPAAEVADRVTELRYPPEGTRGFSGYTRAARYGSVGRAELLAAAPLLGVQVESPDDLDELDTVCAVPGLDLVFFGPVDFEVSSSRLPEADRRSVGEACRTVAAATAQGKVAGCHARSLDGVPVLLEEGFRYVTVGFTNVTAVHWRGIAQDLRSAVERARD